MDADTRKRTARIAGKRPAILNRNFILDRKHGFILAFVPKAACTNWKSVMRYMAGHSDYLNNRLAHDRANGGLSYLDLNGPDFDLLNDPAIRKFSFVRNPYTRALSGYLNKIERRIALLGSDVASDNYLRITHQIDMFRQSSLDTAQFPTINFEVFLRFLRDSGAFSCNDEHWRSQTALLRLPDVTYEFIGRFENLEKDAAEILKRIGCDIPFPTQTQVRFPATGASDRLGTYMTPNCARIIEQVYAADFRMLGYPTMAEAGKTNG